MPLYPCGSPGRTDRSLATRGASGTAKAHPRACAPSGDGWQRTEEDEKLLRLVNRYSTLTLHQAAYVCWGGRIEAARPSVQLMTEARLLLRSADVRWVRTVL